MIMHSVVKPDLSLGIVSARVAWARERGHVGNVRTLSCLFGAKKYGKKEQV